MSGPKSIKRVTRQRGLTLLELLFSLAITAIVIAAIAGMLGAISAGVSASRDMRSVLVLGNAAASRLSSYIAPSYCILQVDGSDLILWREDSRKGQTVHASEVRWLLFDAIEGVLRVHYLKCPSGWSKAACDLDDLEYPASTNWKSVLATYQAKGWVSSRVLVDQLSSVEITTNHPTALASDFVSIDLGFQTQNGVVPLTVSAAISQHQAPVR